MADKQELDLLKLTLLKIRKKEIDLDAPCRMLHRKYKGIIEKYKEKKACIDFMDTFFHKLMFATKPRQLNAYERLYIKLINFTPISATEMLKLKCSDFIIKGDYCLVADKYLLFIPLFSEAKGIPKSDEMFFKRVATDRLKDNATKKKIRALDFLSRALLKDMGLFGIQHNEMRFIFAIYLNHLGLEDLATAITKLAISRPLQKQLGTRL